MVFSVVKRLFNGLLAPFGYVVVNRQALQKLKQRDKKLTRAMRELKEKDAALERIRCRTTVRADLERLFDQLK